MGKFRRKKKIFKKKLYYTYLVSYLVIGIFPMILSLWGYKSSVKIINDEIKTSQSYILEQLKITFDNYMETAIRINQSLADNEQLIRLAEVSDYSSKDHLEAKMMRDELKAMMSNLDFCSDIVVYFSNSGSFITASKRYEGDNADRYTLSYGLTKEEFIKETDIRGLRGYRMIQDKQGNNSILFIQNVLNYNYKDKEAVIIFVLSWNKVKEMTFPIRDGKIFWLNENNDLLIANDNNVNMADLTYDSYKSEGDLLYSGQGKDREISSFRKALNYDIKYCVTMSEKKYFEKSSQLKVIIFFQTLILFSIALVMSFLYSRQSYKPIERIISVVKRNQKDKADFVHFKDMENYLEKLYLENQKMGITWKKAQNVMAGQVILGYLKGWNTNKAVVEETLAEKFSLALDKEYMVFLITFQDISRCKLFNGVESAEEAETRELLQFIIRNIFDEVIFSEYKGALFEMDAVHFCILQTEERDPDTVKQVMQECIKSYMSHLNLHIFIGGSGKHTGINELQRAYNEAVQVLSYHTFWGNENEMLLRYEDISADKSSRRDKSTLPDEQRQLYNLMYTQDYEKAADLLETIMDHIFIKDVDYMEINQCHMFGLINTVYLYLEDIVGKNDEEFFQRLHPMERMLSAKSIATAKKIMKELFYEIVEHIKACIGADQPRWVQDLIMEIEKNHTDTGLNVTALAERVGMNFAYVGRTFKQYTGLGLADYIHMVRIRKCKVLLDAGVNVKDAAREVGYIDSKSLIRIFKKYEGITPGQYKDMKKFN